MQTIVNNNTIHNQQAKLAFDYNELVKELSSHKMTSVGCYEIGETIGQGSFGKVKKGIHKLTGKEVAIKKISKQHASMMAREIHHHKQLKHPNVVSLYEVITTESTIHIVSEYCPNGDLLDALESSGGRCFPERVHRWFSQLIDAVHYCHSKQIVHRDLKLENILLDANDNVKICDFGFARHVQKNQRLETFCGSLSYSAPEIISGEKYIGPETDIWSLGVILYTLLAGEFPFDDDSEIVTQRKIVQIDYQIPYDFSASLTHLIQGILQRNPLERLSIEAILHHPWLEQFENTSKNSSLSDLHLNTRMDPTFDNGITEDRLAQALQSAGFDRQVLDKMRSGQSDTYSTLWHHLLQNMTSTQPAKAVYPTAQPAFPIQTVGFGSGDVVPKPGWLASVKSWFGHRPPSLAVDLPVSPETVTPSRAVYLSGSQKHRPTHLPLSGPVVSELEQLNYNGTPRLTRRPSLPCKPLRSPVAIPPAAFTSRALAETYILDALSHPKEVELHPCPHTPPPSPPARLPTPLDPPRRDVGRLGLAPRSRQNEKGRLGSRTILEEEEEEE
ncbi:kinase-like domain-containing protein [Sporodiniella umbellata]|nr:kinase-like domain-containing protein [Sporodiniella umbellata]